MTKRFNLTLIIGFVAGVLLIGSVYQTQAAKSTPTPTPVPTPPPTPQVSQSSRDDVARLSQLKDKVSAEIVRRQGILTQQTDRVNKMIFLRDNDKDVLNEQIAGEQKILADVQVKIQDQQLTLVQMRNYVVQMNNEYRSFMIVTTKVAIMIGTDHLGASLKQFDDIAQDLRQKADDLKKDNKLQLTDDTKMSDLKNNLDDTHAKYNELYTNVLPIQPGDFGALDGALQSERGTLSASYDNLKKLLDSAETLRTNLDNSK